MVELLNAPSREASKTVPVDLKRVFGSETISLSQVQKLSLYVSKDADAFKVESLTVTARLQNSPDSGIILKNTKYATLNTRFSDDTHHQFNEVWAGDLKMEDWTGILQKGRTKKSSGKPHPGNCYFSPIQCLYPGRAKASS
ncbi:hypothetical protein RJ55_05629 [Drechmeria coniospora]|nr:hypothetical protein RJ55_05629 [Drechmeria coniospora]